MSIPSASATASAPGKVILFGEHAVVYGVTAIAAALSDLRINVTVETMPGSQLELNLSDIKVDGTNGYVHTVQYSTLTAILNARSESIDSKLPSEHELAVLRGLFDGIPVQASQCCMAATYLAQAMLPQLVYAAPESTRGLRITIVSRGLPLGAGLGSSAAYSVALAAALRRLKQRVSSGAATLQPPTLNRCVSESGSVEAPPRPVLEEINGWAFASEVVIHGKPSGLDNTTSCFGGAVFLNRETGRFQSMTSVPPVKILVTNTKVPRSTKVQVTAVRELRDRLPGVIQPVFEVMEQISQRFLALSEEFRTLTNNRPESGNLITLSNPPLVSDSDATRGLGLVASTSLADIERGVSSSFKEGSNRSSNSGSGNGNGSSGSNRSSGSDPSAVSAFLTRAHAELSTLFTINHHQLVALGVSHSALDAVAAASGKLGMACKLTGAGGGGCAITLVPPQSPASATGTFIDEMEARGFECFGSAVGGSGVLWHN